MADKTFYREGLHQVEFIGQEFGENDKGTPTLSLEFLVLAEYKEGQPWDFQAGEQKKRTLRRYLTDKTVNYFVEDIQRLGAKGVTSFKMLDPNTPGHHSFVGFKTDLWCKHEEYDGNLVERWQVPMGEATPMKKVDPAKLRALDNQFGAALKGAFGAKASAPAPAAYPRPSITDDDIPF